MIKPCLKQVKCSKEHKNIHCCQLWECRSCKLQGSVGGTSLQTDMWIFFSTKSDSITSDKTRKKKKWKVIFTENWYTRFYHHNRGHGSRYKNVSTTTTELGIWNTGIFYSRIGIYWMLLACSTPYKHPKLDIPVLLAPCNICWSIEHFWTIPQVYET